MERHLLFHTTDDRVPMGVQHELHYNKGKQKAEGID